jgi:hypothetical protein
MGASVQPFARVLHRDARRTISLGVPRWLDPGECRLSRQPDTGQKPTIHSFLSSPPCHAPHMGGGGPGPDKRLKNSRAPRSHTAPLLTPDPTRPESQICPRRAQRTCRAPLIACPPASPWTPPQPPQSNPPHGRARSSQATTPPRRRCRRRQWSGPGVAPRACLTGGSTSQLEGGGSSTPARPYRPGEAAGAREGGRGGPVAGGRASFGGVLEPLTCCAPPAPARDWTRRASAWRSARATPPPRPPSPPPRRCGRGRLGRRQ